MAIKMFVWGLYDNFIQLLIISISVIISIIVSIIIVISMKRYYAYVWGLCMYLF